MTDLAERLSSLQARAALEGGLTDKQAKNLFLSNLEKGLTKKQAASETGRTATWFRARANPEASNYDSEFAERYERAQAANRSEIVEDVFSAMVKAAKEGNVRAQEKILAAYSEDFSFLRTERAGGTLNVEQLQVFFAELPLEKLLELKSAREAQKQKELPVIDL